MLSNNFAFGTALASLLICITNLIYTLSLQRTEKAQNKIYIIILVILITNAVNGVISSVSQTMLSVSDSINSLYLFSRYIYFVTHTALCPMFLYYIYCLINERFIFEDLRTIIYTLLFVLIELIPLTNPVTNWVYSIDANNVLHRNWAEYLIYIMAGVYYVIALKLLFSSWKVLDEKRKLGLAFFMFVVALGVLLQLLKKQLKVEILMEAVGSTGLLLAIENDDERIDFTLGFYNRAALNMDAKTCLYKKRPASFIIIRITNTDSVLKLTGAESTSIIAEITGSYLRSLVKAEGISAWRGNPDVIYAPKPDIFVMALYSKSTQQVEELAETISARFEEPWDYNGREIPVSATLLLADLPGHISSVSELFYMINCPLPKNTDKKILKGSSLDYIIRRQTVEKAIARGLSDNSFEVYYQPVYKLDGTLCGAEALLRMHDKELGDVCPAEFIPVAEQVRLIDDLDDYVLDSVCKFIKTGVPQQYGLSSISVNLSVTQCLRPGFIEHINRIVEENGVDKSLINFDIVESIAASDYRILSGVITRLKQDGFMFSIDDYGTGYSNVSSVFSLDMDVIKIDKSLLWNAKKNERGMIILENTIRMIQLMRKKILVEGVETSSQLELLKCLNVDYLQGFYFSKPVSKDTFVNLISTSTSKEC